MNAYLIFVAVGGVLKVWTWLSRLRHHIGRSEQVLWLCAKMNVHEIVAHDEIDNPIALQAIKTLALKSIRGRETGHQSILNSLEGSLTRELHPLTLIASTLPSMGLVGTCIGMIGMLNAIGIGAADVTDVQAVGTAIGESLPSMAVAISTTLTAAFFGSVLLFGLISVAQARVDQFIDELDAQLDMFPLRNEGENDA
ncbi:hypothetical protein RISK_005270 [Rhodopirellula islandica]|uniref:MotA/TolQ/ExbB proton channel domain-containing protein n=1 Tax=Rhodopirellula islandica TaxID=595434 RepID=A0A0J1E9R9_RHOIS|nr:MotA/TolQ/ExbB proton channel family protein [Rhodopirellula islandica]KLU02204.1 hypothetical protein RISK_005270 [Rhodopirellula islandica]